MIAFWLVETMGLEPTTSCVQSIRMDHTGTHSNTLTRGYVDDVWPVCDHMCSELLQQLLQRRDHLRV